ncbi:S8/S53 family peptidase [Bradyrhizobium sp. 44]|uniref:S8/S53 family peptidase n=1 Tax=Bradyrhizobium sp. 44 TaxID=2782675 RepID=UPI001FFAF725|nr:S8/S53 family peptidase [Bradyrhizobium sp. 44]MCK1284721.1 S8/S53 family peptidase [Bradyrhizobium sp. 44]
MRARKLLVSCCLVYLLELYLTSASALAQDTSKELLIKTTKLTPELVVAAAKLGKERTVPAKANSDIFKLIAEICGTANARRYYLPVFLSANAGNEDIRSGKTILTKDSTLVFPACLYADEQLATVKASSTRVEWGKLTPTTARTLQDALRKMEPSPAAPTQSTKWIASASTTTALEDVPNADWGGQLIGFDHLNKRIPRKLAQQGPAIVAGFDSARILDPAANEQYKKLLKGSLAADATSLDSTLILNSIAFERTARAQDVRASNQTTDFNRLPTGSSVVTSDFAPGGYHLTLKEGADVKAAAKEIFASLPPTASAVGQLSQFTPYFAEPLSGDAGDCAAGAARIWPIDLDELKTVVEARKRIGKMPLTGRLLILDTGFPRGQVGTAPFDKNFFHPSPRDDDPLRERFLWTVARPPEYFNENSENASHGVGVLALALGGAELLREGWLWQHLNTEGGFIVDLMGYQRLPGNKLGVDANAVTRSLSGTGWGQADIVSVNLSLKFNIETMEEAPDFTGYFDGQQQVLFVMAAGNDGSDVVGIIPAQWGGTSKRNVLTVGAVSSDNKYWPKSNKSRSFVDIGAPGCAVPTLSWNSALEKFEPVVLSGTSFSAPLASFASNLLQEFTAGARRKARILSSGRFSSDLRETTRSSRVLDIPTALATPFDVVRMGDGKMRLGRITWAPGRTLCNVPFVQSNFAQVHRTNIPERVSVVRKIGPNSQGAIDFPPDCTLARGQLSSIGFQEAVASADGLGLGAAETLDIRNIESITFCDNCDLWQP